uniref:Uncharacterized protein n=1 Tax=Sinocyclocheilus anshuiensis TaxID=1608454 RepID=A0A671Q342_9TELE
ALRNACRFYFSTSAKHQNDQLQIHRGVYRGTQKHEGNDMSAKLVIYKSYVVRMRLMVFIITGGNLEDSLRLEEFFSTVGCHPTHCAEFDQQGSGQYLASLTDLSLGDRQKVIAVGECGLGNHIITSHHIMVHSFDGSQRDAAALLDLDLCLSLDLFITDSLSVSVCVCVCVWEDALIVVVCLISRQVLEVMAGVRDEDPLDLAETIYNNTTRLFFKHTS